MPGSSAVSVAMPRLSDSMVEGTIVAWLQPDGAEISRGAALAEIETDKATMVYEADDAGFLRIVAPAGTTMEVGGLIAELHAAQVGSREASQPTSAPSREPTGVAPPPAPGATANRDGGDGAVVSSASPVARRLAAHLGIDLVTVSGSGPRGRILKRDVATAQPTVVGDGHAVRPTPSPASTAKGASVRRTLSNAQRTIARRMAEAKATVPEFSVAMDVDMTAAMELRGRLKEEVASNPPSLNDMVVKAVAGGLREHRNLNSSYRDDAVEVYERINVGIAVAADDLLLVPTITDADRLSLGAIALLSRELVDRARSGSISAAELDGGTFTISNLGMFGVGSFTPVINPPQAAILGVGEVARRAIVLEDGSLAVRTMTTLTLVCDHRVVYGADAGRFLAEVKANLEAPLRLVV
ncbi:MAG: 2-oxo acid dehydrogenase subunit E2 [Solirubrobacteraceae bacterium]|nr:2-oxo acid dehydrogenase subunit E2 [Solirubrobacteraceae bacterium]